jgi:biotin-[acetyl-CoA-carboxylase] ligase BirA-like protein
MPAKKIVETVDSTQSELKRDLEASPQLAHLSWVQAREQTGGRGRQDRSWISARGNLFLSILYRLDSAEPAITKNLTWFPLWVGARVREALVSRGFPGAHLQVKWPNDLYYQGRAKLGGILCEKTGSNIVVGIGLNVAHSPSAELQPAGREVTSLVEAGFEGDDADGIRDAITAAMAKPFDLAVLKQELLHHLIPQPGAQIEWIDLLSSAKPLSGVVIGLGGFGELHVMSDTGVAHLFSEEVSLKL